MKILLVEDDKLCQNSIKNFCKKLEVEVEVVGDGKEAIELCAGGASFDLILMDNYMQEVNGREATLKIRQLSNGSSYLIFMISGTEVSEDDLKSNGFDGFYLKPITKIVFEELVNKYKK
jgi:CheY-like chemotaxis protein